MDGAGVYPLKQSVVCDDGVAGPRSCLKRINDKLHASSFNDCVPFWEHPFGGFRVASVIVNVNITQGRQDPIAVAAVDRRRPPDLRIPRLRWHAHARSI